MCISTDGVVFYQDTYTPRLSIQRQWINNEFILQLWLFLLVLRSSMLVPVVIISPVEVLQLPYHHPVRGNAGSRYYGLALYQSSDIFYVQVVDCGTSKAIDIVASNLHST